MPLTITQSGFSKFRQLHKLDEKQSWFYLTVQFEPFGLRPFKVYLPDFKVNIVGGDLPTKQQDLDPTIHYISYVIVP